MASKPQDTNPKSNNLADDPQSSSHPQTVSRELSSSTDTLLADVATVTDTATAPPPDEKTPDTSPQLPETSSQHLSHHQRRPQFEQPAQTLVNTPHISQNIAAPGLDPVDNDQTKVQRNESNQEAPNDHLPPALKKPKLEPVISSSDRDLHQDQASSLSIQDPQQSPPQDPQQAVKVDSDTKKVQVTIAPKQEPHVFPNLDQTQQIDPTTTTTTKLTGSPNMDGTQHLNLLSSLSPTPPPTQPPSSSAKPKSAFSQPPALTAPPGSPTLIDPMDVSTDVVKESSDTFQKCRFSPCSHLASFHNPDAILLVSKIARLVYRMMYKPMPHALIRQMLATLRENLKNINIDSELEKNNIHTDPQDTQNNDKINNDIPDKDSQQAKIKARDLIQSQIDHLAQIQQATLSLLRCFEIPCTRSKCFSDLYICLTCVYVCCRIPQIHIGPLVAAQPDAASSSSLLSLNDLNHMNKHFKSSNHAIFLELDTMSLYCAIHKDVVYDTVIEAAIHREAKKNEYLCKNFCFGNGNFVQDQSSDTDFLRDINLELLGYEDFNNNLILNYTKKISNPYISALGNSGLNLPGLYNLGNSCYMNSVLQAFLYTPPLRNYLLSEAHIKASCTMKDCLICALGELISSIFSSHTSNNTRNFFVPQEVFEIIWRNASNLATYEQHDAHEFLITSLNIMLNQQGDEKKPGIGHDSSGLNLIQTIFSGKLRSDVICQTCSHSSSTYEDFLDISLDVDIGGGPPRSAVESIANTPANSNNNSEASTIGISTPTLNTIYDCFSRFTKPESLGTGHKMMCDACGSRQEAIKQMSLHKVPPILCVHFKRFEHNSSKNGSHKLDSAVEFPVNNLNVINYMTSTVLRQRHDQNGGNHVMMEHDDDDDDDDDDDIVDDVDDSEDSLIQSASRNADPDTEVRSNIKRGKRVTSRGRGRRRAQPDEKGRVVAAAAGQDGMDNNTAAGETKATGTATTTRLVPSSGKNGRNHIEYVDGGLVGLLDSDHVIEPDEAKYDLYAIINHKGKINRGHYTTIVRFQNKWYLCDDEKVKTVNISGMNITSREAYMLFYVARNPNVWY